jgi:hypothetical protein
MFSLHRVFQLKEGEENTKTQTHTHTKKKKSQMWLSFDFSVETVKEQRSLSNI